MSKHGSWTVIFDDNMIIKRTGEFDTATAQGYVCGGTDFWLQAKFSNLHAIQFTDDNTDNDQVEFKDDSQNGSYDATTYGNFSQFIDLWDAAHLAQLQENWDNNNVEGETEAEKITRLGARPTTYSS
jgi:hypothetical protein